MKLRKIIAVTSDLFVQSRIMEIAKIHGIEAEVKTELVSSLGLDGSNGQLLVILDLASSDYDPFKLARHLKDVSSPPTLFGFYPHVKTELKRHAEKASFDIVVTNHDLVSRLTVLIRDGS